MFKSERSTGSLVLALIGLALVGYAFTAPFLMYDYSSGRRTAEGGFHDPEDTGLIRHDIDFRANEVDGNAPPTDPDAAERGTLWLAIALGVAAAGFAIVVLGDLPLLYRYLPRAASLGSAVAALVGLAAAMAVGWFMLPDAVAGYGISGPFHYEQIDAGYIRSTIGLGWFAAFIAVPFAIGAFAFKYQAGSTDPDVIQKYITARPKPEGK